MRKENDEANLIQALSIGKQAVLPKLYERYADRIFDVSFHLLKDTGWSEDVVQEVFVKLWTNRETIKQDVDLWPFLYVLTKRECLNKLRSIKRSHSAFELLYYHIEHHSDRADGLIERKELADEIENYLAQLPEQQKLVFTLSRIEGIPHKPSCKSIEAFKTSPVWTKSAIILIFLFFLKRISWIDGILPTAYRYAKQLD